MDKNKIIAIICILLFVAYRLYSAYLFLLKICAGARLRDCQGWVAAYSIKKIKSNILTNFKKWVNFVNTFIYIFIYKWKEKQKWIKEILLLLEN